MASEYLAKNAHPHKREQYFYNNKEKVELRRGPSSIVMPKKNTHQDTGPPLISIKLITLVTREIMKFVLGTFTNYVKKKYVRVNSFSRLLFR